MAFIESEPDYLDYKILDTLTRVLSKDRFSSLIVCLKETTDKELAAITDDDLDPHQVRHLAHRIYGMVGNLGLVYLSGKAREIERMACADKCTLYLRLSLVDIAEKSLDQLSKYQAQQNIENVKSPESRVFRRFKS